MTGSEGLPPEQSRCGECGMAVADGEFHPFAFCVMYKAGLDPWQEIRIFAGQLGLGDPGEHPPQITQLLSPTQFARS